MRLSSTCWTCTWSPRTAGRSLAHRQLERDMARGRVRPEQRRHVARTLRTFRVVIATSPCLGSAQDPVDHRAGALVVLADVLQDRADLPAGRATGACMKDRSLGVAQDRAERLVDLVCERRGGSGPSRRPCRRGRSSWRRRSISCSAAFLAVMSMHAPRLRKGLPLASKSTRPRAVIQRSCPSGRTRRNSVWYSPRLLAAWLKRLRKTVRSST